MKLHLRLGTATLAGVFALSAIGAAQAEIENTPETTTPEASPTVPPAPKVAETTDNEPSIESQDRETSESPQPETTDTSTSVPPEAPPIPTPSEPESPDEPLKDTECSLVEAQDNEATIAIPEAEANDRVEVSGSDHYRVDASSQVVVPYSGTTATLALTVWHGVVQEFAECSVTISDETPEPPEDPNSPEETPTDESSPPEPTEPTTPDAPEPTDTPGSTPPPSEPPETAPSPDSPAPPPETTGPAQVPPQQPPPTSQAPVEQAPPQDGGWDRTPSAEPVPQPSSQSTNSIERNIRQHSNNPRHLLSQLWDTDSHNGSGLIMPKPRDNTDGATELETLPPVSEDELDAIKARVSTPDKGNGLDADEMLRADVNERLAHSDTWWLVSSVIGLVILGAGVWWAVARRKPKH